MNFYARRRVAMSARARCCRARLREPSRGPVGGAGHGCAARRIPIQGMPFGDESRRAALTMLGVPALGRAGRGWASCRAAGRGALLQGTAGGGRELTTGAVVASSADALRRGATRASAARGNACHGAAGYSKVGLRNAKPGMAAPGAVKLRSVLPGQVRQGNPLRGGAKQGNEAERGREIAPGANAAARGKARLGGATLGHARLGRASICPARRGGARCRNAGHCGAMQGTVLV